MLCPACGDADTEVTDSRTKGADKRRRRRCLACEHRFSTIEIPFADYQKMRRASVPALTGRFRRRIERAIAILNEPDK